MIGQPHTRRRAWLTLGLVGAAVALLFIPDLASRLRFERGPLAAGEYWRLFSGHLVHGQGPLAAVDLIVLAALGTWWELRARTVYAWILGTSAALASTALLAFSSFSSYVGSSALSSGLFVAALLELSRSSGPSRRWIAVAGLAAFAGKCTLESIGHDLLGLAPLAPGTRIAAAAHWAGGTAGAIVMLARDPRRFLRARQP